MTYSTPVPFFSAQQPLQHVCRGCCVEFSSISRNVKYCPSCQQTQKQRANERHNPKRRKQ